MNEIYENVICTTNVLLRVDSRGRETYMYLFIENKLFLLSIKKKFLENLTSKLNHCFFDYKFVMILISWIENLVFKIELRKQKLEKIINKINENT